MTASLSPARRPVQHRPRRAARGQSPFLSGGFRPFFLGAGVWACLAVPLWIAVLSGVLALPETIDPLAWHRHELVFGYGGAVVAGFVFTAVPNWTGRLPLAGAPLAAFALLWLAGRVLLLTGTPPQPWIAAGVDAAFLILLDLFVIREVVPARNWRNLPICVLIGVLALANGLSHLEMSGIVADQGLGWRGGVAVLVGLISLIGGRIVPSFTTNWLLKQGDSQPARPFDRYDRLVLAATMAALACWAFDIAGAASGGLAGAALTGPTLASMMVAGLFVAVGLAHLARLARWRGWRTGGEALVLILHLGYAWIPAGFILLGIASLGHGDLTTAALHAWTAGAIGTMTLAVMTRASLGHSGRALTAGRAVRASYALVLVAAALRVAAPLLPLPYLTALQISAAAWSLGFGLFVVTYAPIFLRPRAGA